MHMWSDLSQSLKGSISCLYLKFVPEGLNHNEDLFLSQSQIYYTQCGYCRVLSKDMSCQSNTKQPEDLLSGGEAVGVIVYVRTHLLELSEV